MARKNKSTDEQTENNLVKPNLKEKVINDIKPDDVKPDDNLNNDVNKPDDNLNEIIKNHKAFKDLETRINTNADKWTDNSFLLIQGRINALMELIARDELSYINEIKDPKKFLETKLFNEQRFALLKLNIDLLAKVIKSDEDVNETVDIEQLMEAFRF